MNTSTHLFPGSRSPLFLRMVNFFISSQIEKEGLEDWISMYAIASPMENGVHQAMWGRLSIPKRNEKSPFIHPDDHTLYFASDGHPTMGGYDIYYARLDQETEEWSVPSNIGYPINTEADEIALFVEFEWATRLFLQQ